MYDWIDPWVEIDSFERAWRDREDEHREQMGVAARAFSDATYQIRRHAENLLQPLIEREALKSTPPNNIAGHLGL